MINLSEFFSRTKKFEKEAHGILGIHESSKYRIVSLEDSYHNLGVLKLKQDDLLRQALTCVERECFRAAHVMAWSAFMDFLEEKIFEDGGKKIHKERSNWKCKTPEDLREEVAEYQVIESLKDLGLGAKSEIKALHGLLNKRNECAHPTDYYPGLNDTLGYISEILQRVKTLESKKIK